MAKRKPDASPRRIRTRRFRLWAILSVVVLPVLVLVLVEAGFRLAGAGYPAAFLLKHPEDARLISNSRFGFRFFPMGKARVPEPIVIDSEKSEGSLRVVVLGGSAALGFPDAGFGFGRYLEAALRERAPDLPVEVAIAAMTAVDSTIVREIAIDVLRHDPDVLIVMTGNNEVIGPFGATRGFRRTSAWAPLRDLGIQGRKFRFGQWIGMQADRWSGAHYRQWGGLGAFRDYALPDVEESLDPAYRQLRGNLDRIAREASRRDVPVLLMTVPVNLRDSEPFLGGHASDLAPSVLDDWNAHRAAGVEAEERSDLSRAKEEFEAALALDDGHAGLHYRLGRLLLAESPDRGGEHLRRACDLDRLHFRSDRQTNEVVREIAGSPGVTLVDAEGHLAGLAPHGLPGREFFYEHVHLTLEGNYRVAEAVWPHLLGVLSSDQRQLVRDSSMLSRERCERRLGLDDETSATMIGEVMVMMTRPPFEGLPGALEQVAWLDQTGRLYRQNLDEMQKRDTDLENLRGLVGNAPRDTYLAERLAGRLSARGDATGALALWRELLNLHPTYHLWRTELAQALADTGRTTQAIAEAEKTRDYMTVPQWHATMGSVLAAAGNVAEAETHFRETLGYPSHQADARANLGLILMERGELDEATAILEETVAETSVNAAAWNNLGSVYKKQDKRSRAAEAYRHALRYDPWLLAARVNLAVLESGFGRNDVALHELETSLAIDPAFVPAHHAMGLLKAGLGDHAAAVQHLRRVLEARNDDVATLTTMARLLMTMAPVGPQAVNEAKALATRACELTGYRYPQSLDALAMAFAASGEYTDATRTAERALDLARQAGDRNLAARIEPRLRFYESNLPGE